MPSDNHNNGTITVRVVCAIMFLAFSFIYLYCYQADILALEQHVLSGGKTHYDSLIGGIIITVALFCLQLLVSWTVKLPVRYHALAYFPSLLTLTAITGAYMNNVWWWLFPLLLLIYISVVWIIKSVPKLQDNEPKGLLSRTMWVNSCVLVSLFFLSGISSCGNDVLHYRLKAEQCLLRGDYEGVMNVGALSQATDSSLTMIRVYALSHVGKLGESLFEYNITPSSQTLLPNGKSVRLLLYPERDVYKYIGANFNENVSPIDCFRYVVKRHVATKAAADYLLCGYLLDKNLDAFALNIGKYYKIDNHLPKHYREALTLYTHSRSKPVVTFHSNVMETDFHDYQSLEAKHQDKTLRQSALRDTYGDTYWYYFQYAALGK